MKRFIETKAQVFVVTVFFAFFGFFVAAGKTDENSAAPRELLTTSDNCIGCHNQLGHEEGTDLSIGTSFQGSMMAHAAVDPYWLASVRREVMDHPSAGAAIENECAKCHKPMQVLINRELGDKGVVFDGSGPGFESFVGASEPLSLDGVSCSLCHQVREENFGTPKSFGGGFEIDLHSKIGARKIFGPFHVATATTRVMRSATGFDPKQGDHLQRPEFCATCHTLFTHSLDENGEVIARFPEQVPFLEWKHSVFGSDPDGNCQSCHMPSAMEAHPISSVLGKPREGLSLHSFRGGNFFMQRLIGKFGAEVGARGDGTTLEMGARRTLAHITREAADLTIRSCDGGEGRLCFEVEVSNLAGHKLPTAYPSRRVWLHVRVKGPGGVLFESGALRDDGAIAGNDNDGSAGEYEPHYEVVTEPGQVQIYEAILGKPDGTVTTGLLEATRYLKDNRILPMGFDKETANPDIATHGAARSDGSFSDGGDSTRFEIPTDQANRTFRVSAELLYQPVGYRWANNLSDYDAKEPRQFVRMYRTISGKETAAVLAKAVWTSPAPTPSGP